MKIKSKLLIILLTIGLITAPGCAFLGGNKDATPIGTECLAFWIPANSWASQGEDRLIEYIDACAKEGVNFGIEMSGWETSSVFVSEERLVEVMRLYEVAVKRCRKKGIWMFVSIMNNNSHIHKYGNTPYTFTSVWPQALRLLNCVKMVGPENVLVQPVAETQTADGREFERVAAGFIPEFKLVYNGGSRPHAPQYGWPYFATHPTSISMPIPAGSFAVSDCGTTILQLHHGYAGPGNGNLTPWGHSMKVQGALIVGDYAFLYSGPPDRQGMKYLVDGVSQ